jgi:hypothetical protein
MGLPSPEPSGNKLFQLRNACGRKVTWWQDSGRAGLRYVGINDYFLRIFLLCPMGGHRRCVPSGR